MAPLPRSAPLRHTPPAAARLWALAVLLVAARLVSGSEPGSVEYQVKAAFLYRMVEYVEWPASAFPDAQAPIRVAVLGSESVAGTLAAMLSGRTANNRPFVVSAARGAADAVGAHVVFVGRHDPDTLKKVLESTRSSPVLTVTEVPDALDEGSIINFVVVDDRVGFEISLAAASRNGLTLSSRLLAVARRVETEVRR